MKDLVKLSSSENSGDSICEKQIRKEILTQLNDHPNMIDQAHSEGNVNHYPRKNFENRAEISSMESPDLHIREETNIGSYGYGIDSDQIATGSSQNSISNAVSDKQNHSRFNKSKVSSIILTLASTEI